MKLFVGSLGALLAVVVLSGCSGLSKAKAPDDAITAMNYELAHALTGADDGTSGQRLAADPSQAVGTTTLTNATVAVELEPMPLPEDRMPLADPLLNTPMPLPEDRMSLSGLNNAGEPTPAPALSELPNTRE
jgi:hypothetical protein